MTPELIAAIIAFLLAGAALAKQITDNLRLKAQRSATADARNNDSREIREMILKHDFAIAQLKDNQALHATVVDDLRDTVGVLNTNIVKLSTNVDNLTEVVKELKTK